jgi:carbamate kinase
MRYVVALGGNALLRRSERPDATIQQRHVAVAARQLAPVLEDNEVIICHGNGPQIGVLAVESEDDETLSTPFPLDTLGAQTQGMIGYWLAQELANSGVASPIAVIVTQTLVSTDDPAFARPSKFIGPTYTRARAAELEKGRGWHVAADTAGWRRVVPSPEPRGFVEIELIRGTVKAGHVVVCAGGGGAPVTRDGCALHGIEAVVDKDLAAALLAIELHADGLIVLTDVEAVMLGFGTDEATALSTLYVDQLDGMSFPAGSMGPKIEACSRFAACTGKPAVIGSLERAADVLAGTSGTTIRTRPVGVGAESASSRARDVESSSTGAFPTRG